MSLKGVTDAAAFMFARREDSQGLVKPAGPCGGGMSRMSGIGTSRPVKILLVGEHATSPCSLLRHLEDGGCQCLFASSGKDAIRLYGEQVPDLVLCADGAEGIHLLIAFLVGSSASVFRCHLVESSCWWLPLLEQGRGRLPAPALRPCEFTQLLDLMIEEIQSQGTSKEAYAGAR